MKTPVVRLFPIVMLIAFSFFTTGGCSLPGSAADANTPDTTTGQSANNVPCFQLLPLGEVAPLHLAQARDAIEQTFVARVQVDPSMPLPATAYVPSRGRWSAEALVLNLQWRKAPTSLKIQGLTDQDICANVHGVKCFGIFGYGIIGGVSAVISTFRLGVRTGHPAFPARLRKVIVHEIGHTFGILHCSTVSCLMEDAKKTIATVDRETAFCPQCQAKLGAHLRRSSEYANWPGSTGAAPAAVQP